MNNRDKNFKGQHEDENLVCFFRHHWIVLSREFLYFFIYVVLIFLAVSQTDFIQESIRNDLDLKIFFFIGFVVATLYMHRFFMKLLNYFLNVGIITDLRIIDDEKTVFFHDKLDSIDMTQIQNVEAIQEGMMPSLLKFGDIKIYLTASDTIKIFKNVPNAKFHFRCLNRQTEALKVRQHEGLTQAAIAQSEIKPI